MSSVHFLCLQCEKRLGRDTGEASRPCDFCGAANDVVAPAAEAIIDRCAACGHEELYFQKDFKWWGENGPGVTVRFQQLIAS